MGRTYTYQASHSCSSPPSLLMPPQRCHALQHVRLCPFLCKLLGVTMVAHASVLAAGQLRTLHHLPHCVYDLMHGTEHGLLHAPAGERAGSMGSKCSPVGLTS
jgi:hypothetical protein